MPGAPGSRAAAGAASGHRRVVRGAVGERGTWPRVSEDGRFAPGRPPPEPPAPTWAPSPSSERETSRVVPSPPPPPPPLLPLARSLSPSRSRSRFPFRPSRSRFPLRSPRLPRSRFWPRSLKSSRKSGLLLSLPRELSSSRVTVSVLPWGSVTVAMPVSGSMEWLEPSGKELTNRPLSSEETEPSGLVTSAPWVRSVVTLEPSGAMLVSCPVSGSKTLLPPSGNVVAKSPFSRPVRLPVEDFRPASPELRFPRSPRSLMVSRSPRSPGDSVGRSVLMLPRSPRSPRSPIPFRPFRPPRLPRFSVVTVPSGAVEVAWPVFGSTTCVVPSGKVVVSLPSSPREVTDPSGLVTLRPSPRSCVVTLPSGCVVVRSPLSGSKEVLLPSGKPVVSWFPSSCVLPPVGVSREPPAPLFRSPRLPRFWLIASLAASVGLFVPPGPPLSWPRLPRFWPTGSGPPAGPCWFSPPGLFTSPRLPRFSEIALFTSSRLGLFPPPEPGPLRSPRSPRLSVTGMSCLRFSRSSRLPRFSPPPGPLMLPRLSSICLACSSASRLASSCSRRCSSRNSSWYFLSSSRCLFCSSRSSSWSLLSSSRWRRCSSRNSSWYFLSSSRCSSCSLRSSSWSLLSSSRWRRCSSRSSSW
ncbi:hypothetical protein SMICM304S_00822 [Streptomyces microflavus]